MADVVGAAGASWIIDSLRRYVGTEADVAARERARDGDVVGQRDQRPRCVRSGRSRRCARHDGHPPPAALPQHRAARAATSDPRCARVVPSLQRLRRRLDQARRRPRSGRVPDQHVRSRLGGRRAASASSAWAREAFSCRAPNRPAGRRPHPPSGTTSGGCSRNRTRRRSSTSGPVAWRAPSPMIRCSRRGSGRMRPRCGRSSPTGPEARSSSARSSSSLRTSRRRCTSRACSWAACSSGSPACGSVRSSSVRRGSVRSVSASIGTQRFCTRSASSIRCCRASMSVAT